MRAIRSCQPIVAMRWMIHLFRTRYEALPPLVLPGMLSSTAHRNTRQTKTFAVAAPARSSARARPHTKPRRRR